MTVAARRSRATLPGPGRALVLLGAGLACAAAAGSVAFQPEVVLPSDVRMWGTLAFAALAAGFAMLAGVVFVQRRGRRR